MVLREKTKQYTTEDLIEVINNSLLTDEAKDFLIKYVEDIAIQLAEIYHQLSRKSLKIEIYQKYFDADNSFAKFIFDCLSSEAIDKPFIKRESEKTYNLLQSMMFDVKPAIPLSIYENIELAANEIKNITDNFNSKSNGIIVNNQSIFDEYDIDNEADDNSHKSKLYKFNVSDTNNEDKPKKPETPFSDKVKRDKYPDLKLVSLKKLGLKVIPKK